MNNKKQLTKVSVLIDKLNYLNDNLDINALKINDLDLQLLKNYTAELWQVLHSAKQDEDLVTQNQPVKEQLFDQLPKVKPQIIRKSTEPVISTLPEPEVNHIDPMHLKKTTKIIPPPNEELNAKTEPNKDATENIFDTVKAIKKQHKIKVEPNVQPLAFQTKQKPKLNVEAPAIETKSEPELVPEFNAEPEPISQPVEVEEELKLGKKTEGKNFEFMPSKATDTVKNKSVELNEDLAQQLLEEEEHEDNANPSINDRFKKQEENLATVVKTSSNRNFKELIDINDRFLFIQSLFGGSYLAFEEAIKQINKIDNYSEALDYVDYKLKGTYDWSTDSTEVTKFLNILERSYAS